MTVKSTISRRQFLSLLMTAIPCASIAHGVTIEQPERLSISRNTLKIAGPAVRFVHFSDLHFRGETVLTQKVADEIRRFKPHFACFTGDLIDNADHKEGAFAFIRSLKCPVYGVPGNHDYRSGVPFEEFAATFSATGGGWLENYNLLVPGTGLEIVGLAINGDQTIAPPLTEKRILLTHFPQSVDRIVNAKFAAILAGHSHGGQVRLPFYGSLYLPPGVGRYDLGSFQTPVGPLHVTAGIGTSALPVRFCCPPELSLYQS